MAARASRTSSDGRTPSQDGDEVIEAGGVKVYVDPNSVQYVGGAQIDFVDSLYGSGFSINNPNSKGSCGCGHSFQA